ncbi:hypothetical protein [uncultured Sphaerochaeta sp.]|uniref:hypothetical protein n=1 Tax=uncultured Sphaerochaeta sp. TaxID=886478 RepID=UPI002A0A458A|nr:hypothetical protein [uncultured Sphaerochaeta sp.]
MIKDFAVLMTTCDSYYDVAMNFFPILKLYWSNFSEKVYILSEIGEYDYHHEDAIVINAGNNKSWSSRLEYAISRIDENYILFMMDDYYLGNNVSSENIKDIITFMKDNNIYYYCLRNMAKTNKLYPNGKAGYIDADRKYGMSLQAAIWRTDYLRKIVSGNNCSAWQIENLMNRNISEKKEFLENAAVDVRNLLNIQNAVIKGKWVPKVIRFYRRRGYIIALGKREILSIKERTWIFIAGRANKILPPNISRILKKKMKKFGFKFVTE